MNAIRKKIVLDARGNPTEVIIPWSQFKAMAEALGLDLDTPAKQDLRTTRRDWKKQKKSAFISISEL